MHPEIFELHQYLEYIEYKHTEFFSRLANRSYFSLPDDVIIELYLPVPEGGKPFLIPSIA